MTPWLTIVGVGEGGVGELPPSAQALIEQATIVIGPGRLLSTLPPTPPPPQGGEVPSGGLGTIQPRPLDHTLPLVGRDGEGDENLTGRSGPIFSGQRRIAWQSPLDAMLSQVKAQRGKPTVMLATGDPTWFGIGATLASHLEASEFAIIPHPSAFQLAAAKLRWPLQHVTTLSLHGRPVELLHPHLAPGNRILALTSDRATADHVAELLIARGYRLSHMTALENLGGSDERITSALAESFDPAAIGDFYVLGIACVADPGAPLLPPIPGLPDDAFLNDGQLTKREVRAATLAKLAPYPGALLWDVGAGCGSIGIEWMRAARDARAVAFEREGKRLQMIALNAANLGVPGLEIVSGNAPGTFAGHAPPDAIFLGGGVGGEALFNAVWTALRPGGRLVANAVTIEGEAALYARHATFGGDLARIEVSALDAVGEHRVLRPRMAVTQWLVQKP